MLREKIRRTVRRNALFAPGDRVVVAVSGGPDSVCLLAVLRELAEELRLELHVGHLDHGFRGQESADEAAFVERLARRWGLAATVEHRDVPAFCAARGLSAQAGAREVRYAFLEEVARKAGAQRIAVGHTADDQAETVLMRLLRGAGTSGLSGMPVKRDRIVRPLIDATREEVLQYLGEHAADFVNDPSNSRTDYRRNRVRIELLPVLKAFNPRIVETLAAEAAILREDAAALEHAAGMLIAGIMTRDSHDRVRLDRDGLHGLPAAFRHRALLRAIELLSPGTGLPFVRSEETLGFLQHAQSGRRMELPGGLVLEREYGSFLVRAASAPLHFDRQLKVPGRTVVPELGLDVAIDVREVTDNSAEFENYLWQAVFDYAKIALPLRLRGRRPGDAFQPSGMGGGHKKVQDLFVDLKIPRHRRERIPVLATDREVLWVVGLRTDERFLPGPSTVQVLKVTIRKQE